MSIACVLIGSPTERISVDGKIYFFELLHSGGCAFLTQSGRELENVKVKAYDAVFYWDQQGKRRDSEGLCIWDYPATEILEHLGGRHYKVVGSETPVRGK